jgi:hypothetical protein
MRCTPAAATASAHHPTDRGVTAKTGLGGGAGMGPAIVRGHDLDVLVPTPAIAILVLDARIGKVHVTVVVRQLVLPRPTRDLFRLPIWPPVAVLLATVALVEKTLVVTLQLVVENDAADPTAFAAEPFRCELVGTIDVRVVGQLARLPEASVERLVRFVRALGTFVAIGFEEVPAALGQDDGSVLRAERTVANQPLVLQMANATARIAGLVAQVVEITLDTTRNAPMVPSMRLSAPSIS